MSRRTLKTDDEEGFLRAYRDEIWDAEELYGVRCTTRLAINREQKGLLIWIVVEKKDQEGQWQELCQVRHPYPSHSAARLHAALYRAAIGVHAELMRKLPPDERPF